MRSATGRTPRVVVLGRTCLATDVLSNALADRGMLEAIVVERPASGIDMLRARIRRYGLVTVLGQLSFRLLVVPAQRWGSRHRIREILAINGLRDARPSTVRYQVERADAPSTIALLGRLDPDIVLLSGTRVLPAGALERLKAPVVNVHAGITPRYRGVHGGYWALVEERPSDFGATIHIVDPGIDTGPVLAYVARRAAAIAS